MTLTVSKIMSNKKDVGKLETPIQPALISLNSNFQET